MWTLIMVIICVALGATYRSITHKNKDANIQNE